MYFFSLIDLAANLISYQFDAIYYINTYIFVNNYLDSAYRQGFV